MWTAVGTSLAVGLLATAAANHRRWHDGRVWAAFAAGGVVSVAVQLVARPLGAVVSDLADLPAWVAVGLLVVFAEAAKLTAALALHQAFALPRPEAGRLGAAVGAGFGAWSEAVVLRAALQVAQLGLPGGVSLPSAVAGSVARLLAAAGSTGLATRLAASGRTWTGLGLAAAAQLVLDPVLRLTAPNPRWALVLTGVVGAGLFAALWAPGRRAEG